MNHILIDSGPVSRYAVIHSDTVVNVVLWDGTDRWTPPAEATLVLIDEGWGFGVGDIYDGVGFHRRVTPEPTVDDDGYMTQDGIRLTDENGQWIAAEVYYA